MLDFAQASRPQLERLELSPLAVRAPLTLRSLHDQHAGGHDQHAGGNDQHAGGHDKHAGHSVAMFRDRFWLSLLLTLPVLLWSEDLQAWLGYEAPAFAGSGGRGW